MKSFGMFFGESFLKRPFSSHGLGITATFTIPKFPATGINDMNMMSMDYSNTNSIPIAPKNFNKDFKFPPKILNKFEIINKHPNDMFLKFEPIRHVYTYGGKEMRTSVTSLVESYFRQFDADEIISKMMNGSNWPRPEYTFPDGSVYTVEQIKKKWNDIGEYSRNKGTWMHYNIERFINNLPVDLSEPEMKFFVQYHQEYITVANVTPYRTEWSIAAPDLSIGGSVDFVGKLPNGNYVIMDWKRSKKLINDLHNQYGKTALEPINHLDDCEGSKYSLQLNIYRYILQNYYGMTIESMKLASFHPQQDDFAVVDVPPLDDEVALIIESLKLKL